MSIQELIVFALIATSVIYTVYHIVKVFIPKKDDSVCGCSSCDVKPNIQELKKLTGANKL